MQNENSFGVNFADSQCIHEKFEFALYFNSGIIFFATWRWVILKIKLYLCQILSFSPFVTKIRRANFGIKNRLHNNIHQR